MYLKKLTVVRVNDWLTSHYLNAHNHLIAIDISGESLIYGNQAIINLFQYLFKLAHAVICGVVTLEGMINHFAPICLYINNKQYCEPTRTVIVTQPKGKMRHEKNGLLNLSIFCSLWLICARLTYSDTQTGYTSSVIRMLIMSVLVLLNHSIQQRQVSL